MVKCKSHKFDKYFSLGPRAQCTYEGAFGRESQKMQSSQESN